MVLRITTLILMICVVYGAFSPLLEDNVSIRNNVKGRTNVNPNSWSDSYSDGDSCYCKSTFDHDIGSILVDTPLGVMTVKEVCDLLGDGPKGSEGRPLYNDVQCGNGPPNSVGDEDDCPGRVEHGQNGCKYIGPKWNFSRFIPAPPVKSPMKPPLKAPVKKPVTVPVPRPPTKSPTRVTSCVIRGLNLWNGMTNQRTISNFGNGTHVCTNFEVAIEATTNQCVDYVALKLTGPNNFIYDKVESNAPFFLFGNKGTDVLGQTLSIGRYTVTASPNGNGNLKRTITFTVREC
jgi:hypothetical protein